jgi:hypothetical protein
MSRNFAVLGKSVSAMPAPIKGGAERAALDPAQAVPIPQFPELIRRLFRDCSAVAIVGSGFDGVGGVCVAIAAELAASAKRTVIVPVERLVNVGPGALSAENAPVPGSVPNVWHWPCPPDRQIEFFKSQTPVKIDAENWLDSLRHSFDHVLLSCPPLEAENPEPQKMLAADGIAEIAAAADAAVLVVEAGRTPRHQIQRDQSRLQSRGVKLAGCILIRRR